MSEHRIEPHRVQVLDPVGDAGVGRSGGEPAVAVEGFPFLRGEDVSQTAGVKGSAPRRAPAREPRTGLGRL